MIEQKDLSYPVYLAIRDMILKGELTPGEKLLQEKLALQLGVSRTPLLKALQMLEYDYLVESIPRRGMFVKKLSLSDMIDIYDVREGIECVAVRLVSERITPEGLNQLKALWKPYLSMKNIDQKAYRKTDERFHSMILELSRNQLLQKTYSKSLVEARVIQLGLQRPPEETLREHLALIEQIEKGNAEQAELIMKGHIRQSKEIMIQNASVFQEEKKQIRQK